MILSDQGWFPLRICYTIGLFRESRGKNGHFTFQLHRSRMRNAKTCFRVSMGGAQHVGGPPENLRVTEGWDARPGGRTGNEKTRRSGSVAVAQSGLDCLLAPAEANAGQTETEKHKSGRFRNFHIGSHINIYGVPGVVQIMPHQLARTILDRGEVRRRVVERV